MQTSKRPVVALIDDDGAEVTVKTVDRVAHLLRAVATHRDGAMLSAVARQTGLGKGTVHRLLNALIDAGLVFQDQDTKRYRLGVGLALHRFAVETARGAARRLLPGSMDPLAVGSDFGPNVEPIAVARADQRLREIDLVV